LKSEARRGGRKARRARPRPTIDPGGIASGARFIPSPNCDDRPAGEAVRLIVIHNISLPPGKFGGDDIIRLFCNTLDCGAHPYYDGLRDLRVSAHFLVRRGGEILQFVPCTRRAWHAGTSSWRGRARCNDFSIGIELEGTDAAPYAAAQYASLAALVAALQRGYPIEEVVGHSDVAPGRKTDPGPAFDWQRFRTLLGRIA
jgi:AmpD protein